jgi:hypothetical protein
LRAAIHQPQYFPYPGFFHKLSLVDVFVVMDDVQYERGFINRNRILDPHGPVWLTVPIDKSDKFLPILDVKINNEMPWSEDHWEKILVSYSNSRFFKTYRDYLESVYRRRWPSLFYLNLETLRKTMEWLSIRIPIIRESELNVKTTRSQRIIDVCNAIGADVYVSGSGGKDYIDEELFRRSNVELEYQHYSPTPYQQRFAGRFIPDVSILDMLANAGPESVRLLAASKEPFLTAT